MQMANVSSLLDSHSLSWENTKWLTSWSSGVCVVALSASALVSSVNFGFRQLNKKGGECRQHSFPTQFCSSGGQSTVSMQPLVCMFAAARMLQF